MRLDKKSSPRTRHVNQPLRGNQRNLLILLMCLAFSGCGSGLHLDRPLFSSKGNLSGMVAADEPQAVLMGRDVLAAGGSAADAAVAMAFTMTLTLPSQVGIGSAGACLAYDHGGKKVEAVDFVPQSAQADAVSLIPALPRGLFLLHARYGRTRWDLILAPVQALAQRGVPASRAFVREFAAAGSAIMNDPDARALLMTSDGQPLAEGDLVRNPQLGTLIGRMASRGVGEFYSGTWNEEFVAAAKRAGATFSAAEMRQFAPQGRAPLSVNYGRDVAYFAPPPALLGTMQSQSWAELAGNGAFASAGAAERPRLIADTLARAYWPTQAAAATTGAGLVAVDGDGNAVACQLTLNGPFGTGRLVPGFGTFLAAAQPDPDAAVAPMIAINPNSNEFRFAATASGGVAGAKMVLRTALDTLLGDQALPRVVAEEAKSDAPDRIEAARCASGSPDIGRCTAVTDPRGFGLAQTVAGD